MSGPRGFALFLGGAEARGESLRRALASRGVSAEVCALRDWDAREISGAVIGAEEKFGALDALIYDALGADGETWSEMLLDIDEPEWDALMNRRLKGFFLACKYALPYLIGRERPRVVLLLPEAPPIGTCGLHNYAAYAACRAAAEHLSAELSAHGVAAEATAPRWDDEAWLGAFAEGCAETMRIDRHVDNLQSALME